MEDSLSSMQRKLEAFVQISRYYMSHTAQAEAEILKTFAVPSPFSPDLSAPYVAPAAVAPVTAVAAAAVCFFKSLIHSFTFDHT